MNNRSVPGVRGGAQLVIPKETYTGSTCDFQGGPPPQDRTSNMILINSLEFQNELSVN